MSNQKSWLFQKQSQFPKKKRISVPIAFELEINRYCQLLTQINQQDDHQVVSILDWIRGLSEKINNNQTGYRKNSASALVKEVNQISQLISKEGTK